MFIVTKVSIGLTTVDTAKTWTDVIPMLRIEKTIRRMSIREDGKLILLVKNPPYERMLPDVASPVLPHLRPGLRSKQTET